MRVRNTGIQQWAPRTIGAVLQTPTCAWPAAMSDHDPRPPRDTNALVPTSEEARLPSTDAHGFDPQDYDWVPVRRQHRADGWSRDKQRAFVAELADSGSVREACRAVGMSPRSAYALRRARDGAGFAAAWDAAIRAAMGQLLDTVTERAIHGYEVPVFDKDGILHHHQRKFSERLAMFLLRAYMPDLFRHANRDSRRADEPALPPPVPIAEALALLDPVTPPDPHKLMHPDDLDIRLQVADLAPGQLPDWMRDRELEAYQRALRQEDAEPAPTLQMPPEFEEQLEEAKAAAARGDQKWRPVRRRK